MMPTIDSKFEIFELFEKLFQTNHQIDKQLKQVRKATYLSVVMGRGR